MKRIFRSSRRKEALSFIKKLSLLTSAATLLLFVALSAAGQEQSKIRFEAVDVYVNSQDKPLAAYQLEFSVKNGGAKIVGIEGGSHSAFNEPPFYDPKAMQKERVILAAFNTAKSDDLPHGNTRVATIHLEVIGSKEPQFSVKLQTAASIEGTRIPAEASVERKPK